MDNLPGNDFPTSLEPLAVASKRKSAILFGRFGLRAGYGIAIVVIVFLVLSALGSIFALGATGQYHQVVAARMQANASPNVPHPHVYIDLVPLYVIVSDGLTFFGLLGLCWFFSRGERRRLDVYGLGAKRWRDVFPGALWGLLGLSGLVALLHRLHLLQFESRLLYGAPAFLYGLKWLVAFLIVGFAEEYMFRGYLQFTLMRGMWGLAERIAPANPRPLAFWLAAGTLSLLFALVHSTNAGETQFGLVAVFLAGMTFSYALWRTGSLWWGIGAHATWDWAQSFLYGVPDSGNVSVGRLFGTQPVGKPLFSGGSDGPEGSVFVCLALLVLVIALRFTRLGVQPVVEQGSLHTTVPHTSVTQMSHS